MICGILRDNTFWFVSGRDHVLLARVIPRESLSKGKEGDLLFESPEEMYNRMN
jgi:hypothetical protein